MKLAKGMVAAVAATMIAGVAASALAAPTTGERLRNAANETQNWLMTLGTYDGHHYSKLSQINKNNVAGLRVVFMASIGGNGMSTVAGSRGNEQSAPLVEDGFMYLSDSHNKLMKFDVRSGIRAYPLWRFDPQLERARNTGGLALYGDTVIAAIRDARIIALSKESGEVVWEVSGVEPEGGRNAPEYLATRTFRGAISTMQTAGGQDVIIVGAGGAGVGWVGAFDANNGENIWRTYTIPGPGEPNFGTWPDDKYMYGAAMPWGPSTFDPELNIVYMGTGEPSPVYDPEFRPGDNLYSESTLALDADTGEMYWFFQETPNDGWDFDSTGVRMLFDFVDASGNTHKAATNWSRNGFTYTVDRQTGEFLQAVAQVDNINWTKGIDPKSGKPVEYTPGMVHTNYNVPGPQRGRSEEDAPLMCATWGGAPTGIWPPSYDAQRGQSYNTRTSGCTYQTILRITEEAFDPLRREGLGGSTRQVQVNTMANVIAIDMQSGKVANTYTRDLGIPGTRQAEVGALATGGGVVFSGFDDGTFAAFDSDTLALLWEFNTGTSMKGAPISYAIGGKQYVAVIAGGDSPNGANGGGVGQLILPTAVLLVFAL
ncbi:MAG: PQQ-binding-like beta-propeller repeat protein [Proteobacteria bacterium]|nr:PQQ-binding-like beta-propeller repeat protein [Pseudomonadota bacterium]MDA1132720.1 PQQ-binding-like beta-propeller repeat protein [Pseudomonadota bacterium]